MDEWIKVSEDIPVVGAHFYACSENVRIKHVDGSVSEGYFQTVSGTRPQARKYLLKRCWHGSRCKLNRTLVKERLWNLKK